MPGAVQASGQLQAEQAACLMSQQIWCWGRDILRPEGNWLIENGFERITPPASDSACPSIYRLELPRGRRVLLRGFGVFYVDCDQGSIFLPRYEFKPRYTPQADPDCLPWTSDHLPRMSKPSQSQARACAAVVSDCVDWICRYESHLIEQLGIDYRLASLEEWDDGSKHLIPPQEVASAWRTLSQQAVSDPNQFLKTKCNKALKPLKASKRVNHKRLRRNGQRLSSINDLAMKTRFRKRDSN